jgi:hypothetical protein
MSDPWEDEGFGGENSWGGESVEADLEGDRSSIRSSSTIPSSWRTRPKTTSS